MKFREWLKDPFGVKAEMREFGRLSVENEMYRRQAEAKWESLELPVEEVDNPPVDLVKEDLPITEMVECETHGSQPRVNFVLDGEILANYCFHCYCLDKFYEENF